MANDTEKEKKENDFYSIIELEELVNMKARELAKKLKIPRNCRFRVWLHPGDNPGYKMEGGTTVNIYINGSPFIVQYGVPKINETFWDSVRDALRYVPKLQLPYELEVRNVIFQRMQEARKMLKLRYKEDLSEVLHVLPDSRLQKTVEFITRVTVRDMLTGLTKTIESKDQRDTANKLLKDARIMLSRDVFLLEVEHELEPDNQDSGSADGLVSSSEAEE